MGKIRKRMIIATVAVLWLGLFLEWRHHAESASASTPEARPEARRTDERAAGKGKPVASTMRREQALEAALTSAMKVDVGDLIARFELDKQRVCPDEDFKVTLHKQGDTDVDFNIDGVFGDQIVLRATQEPGKSTYHIVATDHAKLRDYESFEIEVLPAAAPECGAKPRAVLDARQSSLQAAVSLEVLSTQNLDGKLSYDWDFGDGTTLTTSIPRTYHSYEDRKQDRDISSYVITVRVSDERGVTATARGSVYFTNAIFTSQKYTGNRLLTARFDRFPSLSGGRYTTRATFRNTQDLPVALERATVTLLSCTEGVPPIVRELPASQIIGDMRLAPEGTAQTDLAIPSEWMADNRCVAAVDLVGDTDPPLAGTTMPGSGIPYQPVNVHVALDVQPPPLPQQGTENATSSTPIVDPERRAKLLKAIAILGTNRVTPAQMEELEATGRL